VLDVIDLPGHDPQANLAFEEELFGRLRAAPAPTLLFYVNDPCVVLGRANRASEWVDAAALEADGVPLLRRFSGGGAVYHDRHNLNFSFLLPKSLLADLLPGPPSGHGPARYIEFFRSIVIRALERGGGGYAPAGVSDITLHGRKVSGNAQRIASSLVLHHGTLLLRCPLAAIERYLPVPPNRPGVAHRGFITGLEEEGRRHGMDEVKGWLADELRKTIGA
jgi:lipoate-protein ligase A